MATFVAYDNPMQALTKRYAVFRNGTVIDRLSTRKAALRRAIYFCRQNLDVRLSMNESKWPMIVAGARHDHADALRLESELGGA